MTKLELCMPVNASSASYKKGTFVLNSTLPKIDYYNRAEAFKFIWDFCLVYNMQTNDAIYGT